MRLCTQHRLKKNVKSEKNMSDNPKTVFFARNIQDVFSQLSSVQNLQVMAGCTQNKAMPQTSIIIRNIEELNIIERRERFIDIGSVVPLSVILERGQKRIPQTLYDAIKTTATPFVRNAATLGGNICANGNKRSLFAPLYALDAVLEFKSEKQTYTVPISRFNAIPPKSFLTKIRVPIAEWDVAIYKRLGPAGIHAESSAFFVFLAMTNKGYLSDIRIVFSAKTVFRDRNLENNMIGTSLPLARKNVQSFIEQTLKSFTPEQANETQENYVEDEKSVFDSHIAKMQFLNLLTCSLEQIS
jgi:CO/xanthine dehydrogenase FAD-binding subunit